MAGPFVDFDKILQPAPEKTPAGSGGRLYFVGVESLDKMEIQFTPPSLSVQRNAGQQAVQIVGRNNPLYQYTAGQKLLTLQLSFYTTEEDRADIIRRCEWLESFTMNDGSGTSTERIRLVFGKLFENSVWVMLNVNYKIGLFNKEYNYLPQQALVDISLALDMERDVKRSDFR